MPNKKKLKDEQRNVQRNDNFYLLHFMRRKKGRERERGVNIFFSAPGKIGKEKKMKIGFLYDDPKPLFAATMSLPPFYLNNNSHRIKYVYFNRTTTPPVRVKSARRHRCVKYRCLR